MTTPVMDGLRLASFPALGTTATVVVDGDEDDLATAVVILRRELDAIDLACSRFRPDSELSRLNATTRPRLEASPLLREAVAVALRAARLTGGLVDPTMGRALRILGYDRDWAAVPPDGPAVPATSGAAVRPDGPAVSATAGSVPSWQIPSWQAVTVDQVRGTISRPPGVELDLGATAKALAADRAAASVATELPGVGVLVSLGGDVAVAGPAPAGGWSVRVSDHHAGPAEAPGQTITIDSGGLATSGTTVRRWRRGGIELHHILDPAVGRPAEVVWRTVSVAAATCVDANIATTAAVVLGPGAPAWLEALGLPARLVGEAGDVCLIGGWPQP